MTTNAEPAADATRRARIDFALLCAWALLTVLFHLVTGSRYGFHRDELATLSDARTLAWGYVAYPPVTPFFAHLSLLLFGTSLTGFRLFAAVACGLTILLTGLMARALGGRRGAQLLAAIAATPFTLVAGSMMQYVSFDYLAWVAVTYFVVRLCQTDDPRWWLALGAAIGFGMLSKYSMPVCVVGIAVGVFSTGLRAHLRSRWLWLGALLSLLIFLPNFLWQVRHHFISLDFLREIHARDVRIGRAATFLPDQLKLTTLALPLALAGLYFYFLAAAGRRFRALGWICVVPFALFLLAKGRGYYVAGIYPALYAAGAVWGENWLTRLRRGWQRTVRALAWTALSLDLAVVLAFFTPLAPFNSRWWWRAAQMDPDMCEEIGWPELVQTVARIRDSLPASDRSRLGILTANYGEAGALELYGPAYGLPRPISGINSFWARGYGDPPPETVIALGFSRASLERKFTSVQLIGHVTNRHKVPNEETTDHPAIYLCRGLRKSWPEFWKDFQYFG